MVQRAEFANNGQPCFLLDIPGRGLAAGKPAGERVKRLLPEADQRFKRLAVACLGLQDEQFVIKLCLLLRHSGIKSGLRIETFPFFRKQEKFRELHGQAELDRGTRLG